MARLTDKVNIFKFQRRHLRRAAAKLIKDSKKEKSGTTIAEIACVSASHHVATDKKIAKADRELIDGDESDFDDDLVKETEQLILDREKEAREKKREKLKEKGEEVDDDEEEAAAAAEKRKKELGEGLSLEQILHRIRGIDEKIAKTKTEITDRVRFYILLLSFCLFVRLRLYICFSLLACVYLVGKWPI